MSELILNKNKTDEVIEICILENNEISEFYVHKEDKESMIGNIYCGTVQNVVDGMRSSVCRYWNGKKHIYINKRCTSKS